MRINENHDFNAEESIREAREGDAGATISLVDKYRPYLKLIARMSLHRTLRPKLDESDIVQEAAMLAARDLHQFQGRTEQEFAGWLRSVVSNVVANAHRHYSREKRDVRFERQLHAELEQSSVQLQQLADRESSPSQGAIRRESSVLLAEALEQLSEDLRQVLMLREIDGLSLAETAIKMQRSRNAVQKLWARAITEMRRILKGHV